MAWGDAGVTMKRVLSVATANWVAGASPQTVDIPRTGILRSMQVLVSGAATMTAGTGTIAVDVLGPWNINSQLTVVPNQGAPIIRTSGYGAYFIDLMHSTEGGSYTMDTTVVAEANKAPLADVFNAPTTTGTVQVPYNLHTSQFIKSLGIEVGLWPLENPSITLQLGFTPNSASGATPFNIYSTTALTAPYLVTGNATVTIVTPSVQIMRNLYEVPENANDDPPYTYVVRWLEETPQIGGVVNATFSEWKATPLSGVLLRAAMYATNGTTGIAQSALTASNALNVLFGADTSKYSETGTQAETRQLDHYGFQLPQGMYAWDFLGRDLTLADVLDLYAVPEVRFDVNSSALGASSIMKFYQQLLTPIVLKARG